MSCPWLWPLKVLLHWKCKQVLNFTKNLILVCPVLAPLAAVSQLNIFFGLQLSAAFCFTEYRNSSARQQRDGGTEEGTFHYSIKCSHPAFFTLPGTRVTHQVVRALQFASRTRGLSNKENVTRHIHAGGMKWNVCWNNKCPPHLCNEQNYLLTQNVIKSTFYLHNLHIHRYCFMWESYIIIIIVIMP